MESSNVLYLNIPVDVDALTARKMIENHAVDKKSQNAVQMISIFASKEEEGSNSIEDFLTILSGSLLERNFARHLLCIHGPNTELFCKHLSGAFNVFSNSRGRRLPPSWWACSIIRNETDEIWQGVEITNGTKVFKDWKQAKQLELVNVLAWEDFLAQYCHLLDSSASESRICCLDPQYYPETFSLFSKIAADNLVLLLKSCETSAYCHFDSSTGHCVVKTLSNGNILIKSLLGVHQVI